MCVCDLIKPERFCRIRIYRPTLAYRMSSRAKKSEQNICAFLDDLQDNLFFCVVRTVALYCSPSYCSSPPFFFLTLTATIYVVNMDLIALSSSVLYVELFSLNSVVYAHYLSESIDF